MDKAFLSQKYKIIWFLRWLFSTFWE